MAIFDYFLRDTPHQGVYTPAPGKTNEFWVRSKELPNPETAAPAQNGEEAERLFTRGFALMGEPQEEALRLARAVLRERYELVELVSDYEGRPRSENGHFQVGVREVGANPQGVYTAPPAPSTAQPTTAPAAPPTTAPAAPPAQQPQPRQGQPAYVKVGDWVFAPDGRAFGPNGEVVDANGKLVVPTKQPKAKPADGGNNGGNP